MPILLLLVCNVFVLDSFAQSKFDSKELGLEMPTITMNPIYGTPGTEIEITITNIPPIPKGIDPRIEFFVLMPFFEPLDSENVPQTCNGEKCLTLYSFNEIKQNTLPSKTITFTLFSKQNPKPIIEEKLVQSICDLKINDKVVERFGHVCNENDQATGEYNVQFGWGIQSSNIYDMRESVIFTVISDTPKVEVIPPSLDDALIQEFQDGLITVAQFNDGLKQLGYDEKNVRQTKSLLGLLDHQFNALSSQEKKEITRVCDEFLNGENIYVITNKENYQRNDVIFFHGCVNHVLPSQDLIIQISNPDNMVFETTLSPEVDGSFYTTIQTDEKFAVNGTYAAELIYGDKQKITSFTVPEFGPFAFLILMSSLFAIVLISRPNLRPFLKL